MSATAVAERERKKRGGAGRRPPAPPAPRPWWGDGPPPHDEWPGVTIEIPAVWVPLLGARKVFVDVEDGEPGEKRPAWFKDGQEIPHWWGEDGGRWESPDGRYYFDRQAADLACDFFPTFLTHHIGEFAGVPFELMRYQVKLLTRPLFGWKRAADGLRRFRKVFAFIPKGGGKSPWGAGVGIFCCRLDNEPAAEAYAVAADREQARIVFDSAKIMVEGDDDLAENSNILKNSIVWSDDNSVFKVLSSDAKTKHGVRPHVVVFDELPFQRRRDLYEALKKSMVKRRQPMMIIICHAGDDDEGIGYEEYEYAKGVLSGTIPDDSCLPVIFEASPEDDWTSPGVWARVNPGHGITVKHDAIVTECIEAQADPRKLNDFLKFHLNRWVNQATAWIPIDWWDACVVPGGFNDGDLKVLQCAAGLDLAQKYDLAAFVITFREMLEREGTGAIEVVAEDEKGEIVKKTVNLNYRLTWLPFFWIPEDTMRQREKEDGVPYTQWVNAGLVTKTDGTVINYNRIYDDITKKIIPRFPLLKQGLIGYDPAFATDIATDLRDRAGLKVHEVLQNYTHLSEPSQIVEAIIKGKRIRHDGHRTLRNHFENVAVKRDDAGRIKPVKPKKSSTKRIDGVVAGIMGIKGLMLTPPRRRTFSIGVVTRDGYKPLDGTDESNSSDART